MIRPRRFAYRDHVCKLLIAAACTLTASYLMFVHRQDSFAFPKSTSFLSPVPVFETEVFPDNEVAARPTFLIDGYAVNVLVIFAAFEIADRVRRKLRFKKLSS